MAEPVWLRARSSRTCPSKTSVVITAADSKYTATVPSGPRNAAGKIPGNSVATRLYIYATPIPSPISVNMFRLRWIMDCRPRSKNGQPPHSTIGVARTNSIHCRTLMDTPLNNDDRGGTTSAIAIAKIGTTRTRLIQKRRDMLVSSGFFSSASLAVRGSSAMPHLGQLPGLSWTISGCIGHVYSTFCDGGTTETGSSAMPHLGQDPGWSCRISECIGHVYSVFRDDTPFVAAGSIGAQCGHAAVMGSTVDS